MWSVIELAHAERLDLADLLEGLTDEQWNAPSLCTGWQVRDVVAHLVGYEDLSAIGLAVRMVKAGFSNNVANANRVAELADQTPEQLLARVRGVHTFGLLSARLGGRVGLLDGMIHQQDIRRPLGIPRQIPGDRLVAAMDFARWAPPIRGAVRARGVRLVATDLDWSWGRGPEVTGPAEALLMAMAARPCALADLNGPGKSILAQHIS